VSDGASAASISVFDTAAMLDVSSVDDRERKSAIIITTPNCIITGHTHTPI
jgi:hypothetical protein